MSLIALHYVLQLGDFQFLYSISRIRKQEAEILDEIRKCTNSIKKSSVEQTATMRAWSVKNKIDVDKY